MDIFVCGCQCGPVGKHVFSNFGVIPILSGITCKRAWEIPVSPTYPGPPTE